MDINELLRVKTYEVVINGEPSKSGTIQLDAQSIGQALEKVSVLRLTDDDEIMVRLKK